MRLSKLQAHIIDVLANHIVNTCSDVWPNSFMTYRNLVQARAPYWGLEQFTYDTRKKYRSAKVSISRAMRSLYDKGLVSGVALAWVIKSKTDWGEPEDIIAWQGGGRHKRKKGSIIAWDVPRYKMWSLTDEGMLRAGITEIDGRKVGDQ